MDKRLIKLITLAGLATILFSFNFAALASAEPSEITPAYSASQVLLDADPLGVKKYAAFPTMLKLSETDVLVAYKRGDAHLADDGDTELMHFNPTTNTVTSRSFLNTKTNVNDQNPELVLMPNGDIVVYVDQQDPFPPKERLGMREYRSTDGGATFVDVGAVPAVGGFQYGYAFDDYVDGNTVYVLWMSFPELTGGQRAVHVLKTTDSGATWTYVGKPAFGYAVNESTLEKYDNGFLIVTRGDSGDCKLFKTDMNFNILSQVNLTTTYTTVGSSGRPKLFVESGEYFLLMRDVQSSAGSLKLFKINPATLALESSILLGSPAGSSTADSYYAEYYLQARGGETYFNAITYYPASGDSHPNIVRKEFIWSQVNVTTPPLTGGTVINENFNAIPTGGTPAGWAIGTAGGTVSVQDVPSATDKSLRFVDTSTSDYVEAIKSFPATTADATVQFKVNASQTNQVFALNIRSGTTQAVTVIIDSTGSIATYVGATKTNVQTYAANTWYDVKVVAKPSTDKFDLYINNILLINNQSFRNAVTNLTDIRFNTVGANTGTFYINDLLTL